MTDRLISVIVPVYNGGAFLDRCVNSILNNSYPNIELILVDDGSTDNSRNRCNSYLALDNRVRLICQNNMGTAAARNAGLKLASGQFIAFADQDDFIHKDFYAIMINSMVRLNADVIVCELTRDMGEDAFYAADYSTTRGKLIDKLEFIKSTYESHWTRNTAPWNKVYRRELFNAIQFPAGKGYEDAYTTYKVLNKAERIAYLGAVLYYWYQNPESYSSKKSNPNKLFFRREAIWEQSEFYQSREYVGVSRSAKKFYLEQLALMFWQLGNDYAQDEETDLCKKKMKRYFRWYFYRYGYLCGTKTEMFRCFELIHPIIGAQVRKFFCPNIYDNT